MGYFKELNIIEMQAVEQENRELHSQQQTLDFVFSCETTKSNSDLDNVVIFADFIQSSSRQLRLVSAN